MPPYLTRIEGPPPKRNVVSSSLAGGAKIAAVSRFLMVYSGFLLSSLLNGLAAPPERFYAFSAVCLLIGFEHFSGFANGNRGFANTIFPNYFSDGADASNAARVLASSGDLRSCSTKASRSRDTLSGSFGPWFLPEGAPSADQDWRLRRRRPRTSGHSPCGPRPECGYTRW